MVYPIVCLYNLYDSFDISCYGRNHESSIRLLIIHQSLWCCWTHSRWNMKRFISHMASILSQFIKVCIISLSMLAKCRDVNYCKEYFSHVWRPSSQCLCNVISVSVVVWSFRCYSVNWMRFNWTIILTTEPINTGTGFGLLPLNAAHFVKLNRW